MILQSKKNLYIALVLADSSSVRDNIRYEQSDIGPEQITIGEGVGQVLAALEQHAVSHVVETGSRVLGRSEAVCNLGSKGVYVGSRGAAARR